MRISRLATQSILILFAAMALIAGFGDRSAAQTISAEKERELIDLLRSDAPPAEKALACKRLAIDGSSEAVPELAKLLSNEQLASWARTALEAIPGTTADEALRKASEGLHGKLLVGTLNSIGVRRDAAAVELLAGRLQDPDADVAAAAAVALGHIGNAAAAKALRPALISEPVVVRSAVAEGLILCAEQFHQAGKSAEAVELYDLVRQADVPRPRKLEATRGAILARNQEGIPLLLEQLQSPDKGLFQVGLGAAREFPGNAIDKALAAAVERATPERAALVIVAMADRPDTVDLPTVLKAAGTGPKPVRLAAINALARVGNATCLVPLLEMAIEPDAAVVDAAKAALADLSGPSVDKEIVARLSKAQGKTYLLLIELVGQRRIEAVNELLKALEHPDKAVRGAALAALGNTVTPKTLVVLTAQITAPKRAEDSAAALLALKTASIRMPDREACATELAAAMDRSPATAKGSLLEILGAVGGAKALQSIGAAAKSNDPQLQDVSSKLLGEWMTIDAAPVLLDLSKTAPGDKYQVRALRGYIRIARQFVMPEPERLEMCQNALAAARQPAEQKLVLEILKRYPSVEMLKLAVNAAKIPDLKDDSAQAAVAIAQKIVGHAEQVKEQLSKVGLGKVKLEIVKAEYGAGSSQKDVTETLQKLAGETQIIPLTAASFNETFGGDPAPGAVKQLKVQYRLNGKTADASFPENANIVLPLPK